jgi:hypothetical protein
MSSDTKAMEDALQAAVAKMNRSASNGAAPAAADPLSLLMTLLPKLLENRESPDEIVEKLEGLQSEELAPLREQVRLVRVQLHRVRKSQQDTLEALHQLREQQAAVGEAVLHLAKQMSRLEIFEGADDVDDDDDLYAPDPPPPSRRAESAAPRRATIQPPKTSIRTKKNSRHERS